MEAVRLHGSSDHPITHNKSLPTISNYYSMNSAPFDSFLLSRSFSALLQAPHQPPYHPEHPWLQQPPPQAPLLPLPTAGPRHSTAAIQGLSYPPANKNPRNKKLKSPNKNHIKKGEKFLPKKSSNCANTSPTTIPSGPDPKELPKNVVKVSDHSCIRASNKSLSFDLKGLEHQYEVSFSGSGVFTLSPSPSSLPLPTFILRSKLRCNSTTEPAGVDTGAANDIRRLLRSR